MLLMMIADIYHDEDDRDKDDEDDLDDEVDGDHDDANALWAKQW